MYSYGSRRLTKQTSKISAKAWQPAILINVTPVTIDLANISRNWEVLETRFVLLPVNKISMWICFVFSMCLSERISNEWNS